jgi:hypothetical protein
VAKGLKASAPGQPSATVDAILFDHGTPKSLARALPGYRIITAQARGWDRLNNGALLNAAGEAAIDLLL